MDVQKMLNDLIEEEIVRIEQNGEKVRLKTIKKKRIVYTVIFGLVFILSYIVTDVILALIALVGYFFLLYHTNNESVITKLAKKSPDTPVSEIIRGEMK